MADLLSLRVRHYRTVQGVVATDPAATIEAVKADASRVGLGFCDPAGAGMYVGLIPEHLPVSGVKLPTDQPLYMSYREWGDFVKQRWYVSCSVVGANLTLYELLES